MKEYRFLLVVIIVLVMSMVNLIGCKDEIAQPTQSNYTPVTPLLTSINPDTATAGVNTITILGQNFGESLSDMTVYFDTTQAEILSLSNTSITVRRPGMSNSAAVVKVVSAKSYIAAKLSPYRVDPVFNRYGSFLDNVQLGIVAVDSLENIYVTGPSPYNIWKITPTGTKTVLGAGTRTYGDARIRYGMLYLTAAGGNRQIVRVDLNTGVQSIWTNLTGGHAVKFGDFDTRGYFYAGGGSSDLCILPPDIPAAPTNAQFKLAGAYATDSILAVRVYDGYVYVASKPILGTGTPVKIWKHLIRTDTLGLVGPRELVFDMNSFSAFSNRIIKGITFSSTGLMYIATDSRDPLLVYDPAGITLDYFYKNIVPPNGKQFYWGNGNFLYMISNDPTNSSAALIWNVVRIDMGITGALR